MTIIKNIVYPDYWEKAILELKKKDRILKKIIPLYKGKYKPSANSPFLTLIRFVLGQQVSVKSADTIWGRLIRLLGDNPSPKLILDIDSESLRVIGISKRKIEYLKDIADHFVAKHIQPEKWADMDDESIISDLSSIRGVGRWTAEMFLIFNLQRPDVMPLDDLGLLKAISIHYFSGEPVSRFEAREVSVAWRPWRTVATWYLWRSIE
ncbi:DNA-3-methyladenine glycosylase II [Candidatus Kinetoplastibacterium desouzaii TCC079E]|uniref:DNA-3-methyladenine glycosylase II n=1 Tax=Candidatus Kinetoplastidibacterium desouzai TCC079E TaxID=1208919 RepID=M1M384_9PROT|nr:DNA-3-methyladenine glycosylase [Candidatus Kinetoplastibacterium desouzaii]AGF46720.1 DNA-3-methyladenine glycosylase II [Candidatus Kinetoplastibacterium desouzaii TCC079E]